MSTTHRPALHDWGDAPELFGPRHDYREALVLRRLLPALPGPGVLNAGAGAGSLTLRLVDAGLRVTSVDASAELCGWLGGARGARRADGQPGRCAATCSASTCRTPPSTRPSAPRCWSTSTTTRPPSPSCARVLRPGGLLLVTVPANPYRYDWTDRWAGHRRRYTVATWRAARGRRLHGASRSRGWGFPLTGLYHRQVYRRALRRRLAAGGGRADRRRARRASRRALVRAALEIDSAFVGRRPGYHGLLAVGAPAVTSRSTEAAAAAPAGPLRRWGGLAAGLLVLGFLGWALVDGWSTVSEYDWDLEPGASVARRASCSRLFYADERRSATARSWTACTTPGRRALVDAVDLGPLAARPVRPRERS